MKRLIKCSVLFLLIFIFLNVAGISSNQSDISNYNVVIEGLNDKGLLLKFKSISKLITLKKHRLPSLNMLKKRAQDDIKVLKKLFNSYGYYDGVIAYNLNKKKDIEVKINVQLNNQYVLDKFEVFHQGSLVDIEDIEIELKTPIYAEKIIQYENNVIRFFKEKGYPWASLLGRKVSVDRKSKTAHVKILLVLGTYCEFGKTKLIGLKTIKPEYISQLIAWKEKEPYNIKKIEETKNILSKTELFSSITINHNVEDNKVNILPIEILLEEDKQKEIGAGIRYASNEGVGVKTFWEHHNLWRSGERFRTSIQIAKLMRNVELDLYKPNFKKKDQAIKSKLEYKQEDTKIYDGRGVETYISVERLLGKNIVGSVGIGYENTTVTENSRKFLASFFFIPTELKFDNTDNLLDPSKGFRGIISLVPGIGKIGNSSSMAQIKIGASSYNKISDKFVVASFGKTGTTIGPKFKDLIANKKFYLGGNDSLRGYKHQMASPLDNNGKPIGGISFLNFGLEGRYRVSNNLGIVTFVDTGMTSKSIVPKINKEFLWSVGAGVRYYTFVGPIRFDVSFPTKRRSNSRGKKVDSFVQVYFGIGQAF